MYNIWRFMLKRKIYKANEGVVGIVVAVLLIGLIVTFLSIIQMQYVPEWMKQKEAEHMDDVTNQFSDIKYAIDTQTLFKEKNILITSPVTLGSSELSFFVSIRAYGQLDIIKNAFSITFIDKSGNSKPFLNNGIIKYSSVNGYLENQNFIYESGAVITSQNEGNFISIDPSFKIDRNKSAGVFNIYFKIVDVVAKGGKISESGYDTTSIKTEFTSNLSPGNLSQVKFIIVKTSYKNSWYEFFRSSLNDADADLKEGSDYTVSYDALGQVIVEFLNLNDLPLVNYENFVIEAQIGAGIVK